MNLASIVGALPPNLRNNKTVLGVLGDMDRMSTSLTRARADKKDAIETAAETRMGDSVGAGLGAGLGVAGAPVVNAFIPGVGMVKASTITGVLAFGAGVALRSPSLSAAGGALAGDQLRDITSAIFNG